MEELVNYLAFMTGIVVIAIILFELPVGSRIEVEKSRQIHTQDTKPHQGYWDYLLVAGMGILVLLEIFLISI